MSSPPGACSPPLESEIATTRGALLREHPREPAADGAGTLDGDAQALDLLRLLREHVGQAVEGTARGRLAAAERAADRERLARDDAEHGVALVHRVGVEDPGHHALVGADVGGRDVLLRPDLVDDLARVAARHPLELAAGELLGIDDHAALRAAERQAHQRALPRHRHRQALDLVLRDAVVVADAALGGAARDVVGDAVARVHVHGPVVRGDGDRDLDRFLAALEDVDQVRVDAEGLADLAQLLPGDRIRILVEVSRCRARTSRRGVYRGPTVVDSADPEADRRGLRRSRRRDRENPEPVHPAGERAAARTAPGDAEGVAPGQHVA